MLVGRLLDAFVACPALTGVHDALSERTQCHLRIDAIVLLCLQFFIGGNEVIGGPFKVGPELLALELE